MLRNAKKTVAGFEVEIFGELHINGCPAKGLNPFRGDTCVGMLGVAVEGEIYGRDVRPGDIYTTSSGEEIKWQGFMSCSPNLVSNWGGEKGWRKYCFSSIE